MIRVASALLFLSLMLSQHAIAAADPATTDPATTDLTTSADPSEARQASGVEIPPPPEWQAALDALYDDALRVPGLEDRTFPPEHWWAVAQPLLQAGRGFSLEEMGRSVEDRPLRHVAWGEGGTRVLLWSQMHGDESTASMALADLFRFLGEHPDHPLVQRLRRETALHFLPVMNPDGAARFQRRNAQGIDINRDARALASPEGRTLKALRDRLRPEFGFNLHDQRVGYRAGDSDRGVAVALLAPPFNEAREINPVRQRAIEVAATMRASLEPYLAGHMARWGDTFNPRAFGDMMTRWGTSTILVESGGIEGDPEKQALRKLNFLALVAALDAIATGGYADMPHAPYDDLPENGRVWPDLLVTGATLAVPGQARTRADVLVNFRHPLAERGGTIADVGDLADIRARHAIDAEGLYVVPLDGCAADIETAPDCTPRIDTDLPARFTLSRDPDGRDIVWTLDGDVDPAHRRPVRADGDR